MNYERNFTGAIREVFKNAESGIPTMVISPTATGKTTTIPYLIHRHLKESNRSSRVVVCIPTRIAAVSVTARAQELYPSAKIEHRYGTYSPPSNADIVYSTPNQLLLEYVWSLEYGKQGDSFPWDAVVIDEVHMRTSVMSLILSFHRLLLKERRETAKKIVTVLMTATQDVDLGPFEFVQFPVASVSPPAVTTVYLETSVAEGELNQRTADLTVQLTKSQNPLSILVFVKGIGMAKDIENRIRKRNPPDVEILLLNGKVSLNEFQKIMRPISTKSSVKSKRRVIISTNVAESSITIPFVGYVVDTLLERRPANSDPFASNALEDAPITVTSSEQRKGRVGRSAQTGGIAYYYPMKTQEEYEEYYLSGNYPESKERAPDIQLASPLKMCIFLIDRRFSPRVILEEVRNLNETFLEMIKRNIITVSYTINDEMVEDDLTDLMDRYSEQFDYELEEELDEDEERLEEHLELTDIGKFWMQTHRLDYMPLLFIYNWCFVKQYDPIVGCLIAVIMNEDHEGIFSEMRPDQTRESWIEHQKETYDRYLGVDPLSTLLYLFYDLFRFLPLTASLTFEAASIRSWCSARRIGFEPLYNILLEWKVLCGVVAQKSSRSMSRYMDVQEAILKTIECSDPMQKLTLFGKSYGTYDSEMKDVRLHYGGVPYLEAPHADYPRSICYLKLRSVRLLHADVQRSFNFFVLGDYEQVRYDHPLASLVTSSVKYLDLDDGDRYRRVLPYEIGLIHGLFRLPEWVEEHGEVKKSLVLPSCIFPPFLGTERNVKVRTERKPAPEIEYVFEEQREGEDYSATIVLNMLLSLTSRNEELNEQQRVAGAFYPVQY